MPYATTLTTSFLEDNPVSLTLRQGFLAALLSALFTLTGCANMIAATGDEPVDRNHGKRTFGAKIEDSNIERKAKINLYRTDRGYRDDSKVKVISVNGNVLLAGEVPNNGMKEKAGQIIGDVRHVLSVHNELAVQEPTSLFSRFTDTWITGKAKTRLLFSPDTPGRRTKIVTRRGVVYVMGLLSRAEADAVVQRLQKVYGAQRIIKIIEYID